MRRILFAFSYEPVEMNTVVVQAETLVAHGRSYVAIILRLFRVNLTRRRARKSKAEN